VKRFEGNCAAPPALDFIYAFSTRLTALTVEEGGCMDLPEILMGFFA
jgi:hypothetical protein